MKYEPIDRRLFIKNREKFTSRLKPGGIAVFNSNDIYPISADSTMPFQQARDLFYLSGIDQEESILVLFPTALKEAHREILFLKETNAHIAVWEGVKLSKDEAFEVSGIKTVYWFQDFERVFSSLMREAERVYLNTNEHYRYQGVTQTREDRFIKWCKEQFPAHAIERSNPILQDIRGVKEPEEIALMQKACDITERGFRRVLAFLKPGVWEYEVEAEFLHEFVRHRSRGFAYTPIIACGENANVLHYIENNKQCHAGELLLIDAAAEYANYSSDLTRTIPVNGRFTERQKAVYKAVLEVKARATEMLIPGMLWEEHYKEVCEVMNEQLLGLGLLDRADIQNQTEGNPACKKYFMHGISHHLGLDTHDYGALKTPMKAGMVFTVEPGIYIPEEGFGIRLEDNVVVQQYGKPLNMMAKIPIEIDEIEHLMNP